MKSKKTNSSVVWLFALTYMISYITRINYGAVISEMVISTGYSKQLLSLAVTGSFVTYGLGQIVSGALGDMFSPKRLISFGFLLTSVMNFLIPLCKDPFEMLVVWSINGFAQSFMWPPIVKILATNLSDLEYKKAVGRVSYGSNAGTIAVYLISPFILSVFGWKAVFRISALLGAVMMIILERYNLPETAASAESCEKTSVEKSTGKVLVAPVMIGIMISIIIQGMLRDGVTTWMPSYISETYNIDNKISILSGVILPLFSIISFKIATVIHTKKVKNPVICAALFFCVASISTVVILMSTGKNIGLSVVFLALLMGSLHSVNLMLICMLPNYFKATGAVSTVSGVLNSCTYIGSASSTYGIAMLSEKFGWNFTISTWLFAAVLGTVLCLICGKYWKKYSKETLKNK